MPCSRYIHLSAGSASFGAQRDFVLRWNVDPSVKWAAPLGAGDLLVMRGDVQASVLQAERGHLAVVTPSLQSTGF